ncbi:low temperature requirement protein A [Kitasatospora griseola]|uniref:low temperature requirement protein A n=1 Tax=Kitasatospora griseola TaxID=2064 RepID=UPI0037FEECA6
MTGFGWYSEGFSSFFGRCSGLRCASCFRGGESIPARYVATTDDRLLPVRHAVSGQYPTLAGLVALALAVGAELAIGHPAGPGSTELALLLFGGPILYLITRAWWYCTSTRQAWRTRLLACLACLACAAAGAAAGAAAPGLPPLASVLLLDAVLFSLVLALTREHRDVLNSMTDQNER